MAFERQNGRVVLLPPSGAWDATMSIEIHDTPQGVADMLKEIVALQAHAKAQIHREPQAKFSPQGKK